MNNKNRLKHHTQSTKYAILIQVFSPSIKVYDKKEIIGLAETAGYEISGFISQNRNKLSAKYFLGRGKVNLIKKEIEKHFNEFDNFGDAEYLNNEEFDDSDELFKLSIQETESVPEKSLNLILPDNLITRDKLTIIFNNNLSEIQEANLHGIWDVKVIDRDELILEIFEQHAKSRQSKLQIELVRLSRKTKIVKSEVGKHLSEKAGKDFKGKGMKAWEPKMLAYRKKHKKIKDELEKISQQRNLRRKRRDKFFNVGIIGYTNAGKSTLLNNLSKSDLETADQEFTTVSTTARKVTFPKFGKYGKWEGEEMIFTDSVGFISDMSQNLLDAFLSTLEELLFSDILVIIIDISDKNFYDIHEKLITTFDVIQKIGANEIPKVLLLNKIDLTSNEKTKAHTQRINQFYPNVPKIAISAKNIVGFDKLGKFLIEMKNKYYRKYKKY